ncbi:hypothetical protein, partial [Pseudonocardia sp. KRD291]|uniref:hypothetical protein n=1 Tax=Pseudonocardia sp. KRD291 TaxID=2792007 RepID=UPI001C4A042C
MRGLSPGWRAEHVVAANPLRGSNGIAFGPDGLLYVAQFTGGRISTLDVDTGETAVVADAPLTAPDDLAFDADGTMYVVDLPPGLVRRRDPDGSLPVVADGIAAPDGIACVGRRLFVNELVPDGRLLEIELDGGPPRVLAGGLVMGNAMQAGPDGQLYYPHLGGGEVWRVAIDGPPRPELVLDGLDRPVAVRFDRDRALLVLSNATGELLRLDLDTGARTVVETGVGGADNVAVGADGRLFVSGAFRGGIVELAHGHAPRSLVPEGLHGPFGITVDGRGRTVVADEFALRVAVPGGAPAQLGALGATTPLGARGIAIAGGELQVTTRLGELHAGDPERGMRRRAAGLREPGGVVAAGDGGVLVAETGAGRVLHVDTADTVTVLADGLDRPVDVVRDASGACYVSESGHGRVVRVDDGAVLADGLDGPEGLAALDGWVYCVEARAGRLTRIRPSDGHTATVVTGLATAVLPGHVAPGSGDSPAGRPVPFHAVAVDGASLLVGA